MKEIPITDDQRKRAKDLYEFNVLNGSVTNSKGNDDGPYTSVNIGEKPPAYCSACENLFKYTLNE